MKDRTALMTPLEIASFSYLKGHSQAIFWVKDIGETFFGNDPEVVEVLEFIVGQLQESQKAAHDHFMNTFESKNLD